MGRYRKGRVKLTCRIAPGARDALYNAASFVKPKRKQPPVGELLSALILGMSDDDWRIFLNKNGWLENKHARMAKAVRTRKQFAELWSQE